MGNREPLGGGCAMGIALGALWRGGIGRGDNGCYALVSIYPGLDPQYSLENIDYT